MVRADPTEGWCSMQARTLTLALAVATGLAAMIGGVAAANDAERAPTIGAPTPPGAPAGYELRVRGPISAPANAVTRVTVKCKANGSLEHALGGVGAGDGLQHAGGPGQRLPARP
jgi:hypothetical protein